GGHSDAALPKGIDQEIEIQQGQKDYGLTSGIAKVRNLNRKGICLPGTSDAGQAHKKKSCSRLEQLFLRKICSVLIIQVRNPLMEFFPAK
ncbi:MAG TPA: hypothetical protein VF373_03695, partial [Prolixibacteraceae bacterium]